MEHEVTNLSLADATRHAPYLTYARCVNAHNRPAQHVGDWPQEGRVYPVRLVPSLIEGMETVHILGFAGEHPYYNAFGLDRFAILADVWLN